MNKIRAIQALNQKEIENGISPNASWHVDYRDTAFVYFGGLPYELTEGDIITIFSQFGEPVYLKLARDKETGKSKGFGWLKYEDQRSADLAVDNLGGADIGGRLIGVDHARYKARDDDDPDEFKVGWEDIMRKEGKQLSDDESGEEEEPQAMLPQERELALLIRNHDEEDPMKAYLIKEKKREIEEAVRKTEKKESKHRHKHRRSHRLREDDNDDDHDRSRRSHRDRTPADDDRRSRHRDTESRRHRDRDDPAERGRRPRSDGRDRDREDKDDYEQDSKAEREGKHRRREKDDPDERRHRKRRDEDDYESEKRRRTRSRSPRHRGES